MRNLIRCVGLVFFVSGSLSLGCANDSDDETDSGVRNDGSADAAAEPRADARAEAAISEQDASAAGDSGADDGSASDSMTEASTMPPATLCSGSELICEGFEGGPSDAWTDSTMAMAGFATGLTTDAAFGVNGWRIDSAAVDPRETFELDHAKIEDSTIYGRVYVKPTSANFQNLKIAALSGPLVESNRPTYALSMSPGPRPFFAGGPSLEEMITVLGEDIPLNEWTCLLFEIHQARESSGGRIVISAGSAWTKQRAGDFDGGRGAIDSIILGGLGSQGTAIVDEFAVATSPLSCDP